MLVLNYQRMSTEDGPGLRTSLFVKGCPLECLWCHNPESIALKQEVEWISVHCMACHHCIRICTENALEVRDHEIRINKEVCTACGACVDACPTAALEIKGQEESVDEIFEELIKDRAYFGADGGVTLSGGEIMIYADEAAALLKKLKAAGIGTTIDTSGLTSKTNLDKVFDDCDIFLYDIKLIDSDKHKKYTGVSNELILDNFIYLADKVKEAGKTLWVRTPIIPDSTDSDENIRGIARFIKGRFDRWELCAFNNLCKDKYERLYQDWFYQDAELMSSDRMDELLAIAKNEGLTEVYWTGATRISEAGV